MRLRRPQALSPGRDRQRQGLVTPARTQPGGRRKPGSARRPGPAGPSCLYGRFDSWRFKRASCSQLCARALCPKAACARRGLPEKRRTRLLAFTETFRQSVNFAEVLPTSCKICFNVNTGQPSVRASVQPGWLWQLQETLSLPMERGAAGFCSVTRRALVPRYNLSLAVNLHAIQRSGGLASRSRQGIAGRGSVVNAPCQPVMLGARPPCAPACRLQRIPSCSP